jgi:hypothetical protein
LGVKPHDEVGREADPVDGQPEPSPDFDQDQREGDRDAEAPIQDVVEEAVPRIVVLLGVAPEPLLLEEELAQAMEPVERAAPPAERLGPRGQAVQSPQMLPDIQGRVLRPGDQQRRSGQIQLGLRALNRGDKLAQRVNGPSP